MFKFEPNTSTFLKVIHHFKLSLIHRSGGSRK